MDSITPSADMAACLRTLAGYRPADTALVVIGRRGELRFDYATLDRRARAVAASLRRRCAPGERALLLLENDEHYVVAFFACLYAGVIAVPAFPPEPLREQALARLAGIAADAEAACILTAASIAEASKDELARLVVPHLLAVDTVDEAEGAGFAPHLPHPGDIAFLQYTSGSTSAPKGVMVSHGNLMANGRAIAEGMAIGAADTMVSWLPLYHDMGLIGGMLQPFHAGAKLVLMSPAWFIERPLRWLEAIARHRGTVSGAPDFGFRLCLDRVRPGQADGLDLSSLRVLYSGAEPVRETTLTQFCARFAETGLDPAALYPCYGLAEATLFVTGAARGAGMSALGFDATALAGGRAVPAEDAPRQVACGNAAREHAVAIVDADTHAFLPDGSVGEIWAAGPSIALGYWRNAEAGAATFVEHAGSRWLRTGDLGFFHEGQLHICGRRKDLIILRGQNVYPQDLELALEAGIAAIRRGRVATFAVPRGIGDGIGDGIGVALEVAKAARKSATPQALLEQIGAVLAGACQEPPAVILLLEPGSLPKTSSGKLQRSACRAGWQDSSLAAYAIYESGRWNTGADAGGAVATPLGDTETALAALWGTLLGCEIVDREAQFFISGGNSLAAAQLVARIRALWRLDYTLPMLFSAPRLREVAAALDELARTGRHALDQPILPLARDARLPASYAQARQWLLWQMDPLGSAYHIGGGLRLRGSLDEERLRRVLTALAQRHEPLRTVFAQEEGGALVQRILPARTVEPLYADCAGLPREEAEQQAARQAQDWLALPFDLAQDPPWRVGLVRLAADEHLLVLVIHHIAADAASLQVLLGEFAALYAASSPELSSSGPQYADYAHWQHERLAAGEGERQLAWWRAELGDTHPVLTLQADAPRRAQAWPAAQFSFTLPFALLARLRAATQGKTLFTLLLAGFQALLHRYSGMPELRVGVPVANRGRPELDAMVGMFVNTQLLRSVADGRTTLGTLLEGTAARVAGAQANQDLPFEQLLAALRADGVQGAPFEVMFNHLQEPHRALTQVGSLQATALDIPARAAQCELVLETLEQPGGGVHARVVYADGLFAPERIQRMAAHYLRMLEAFAEDLSTALGDVVLLDAGELAWQAAQGMAAPAPGLDHDVASMIAAQAARTPEALAVVAGNEGLSYADLERRACHLAGRLLARGAAPESRVAVALGRGASLVVGLLAVLKTGAAYVPLDPEHPPARLEWMLRDSGASILLTESALLATLPRTEATVLADADATADAVPAIPERAPRGANLAYVIYTSGSTGTPKGVAVAHGALAAHVRAMADFHDLSTTDRVLLFSSVCFDAAADQLWAPLLAGAAVVVADPARLDAAGLLALVRTAGVTVLDLPPAYLHQLGATFSGQETSLRLCIAGGEGWSASALAAARAALPGVQLVNAYGPTEAVVTACAWRGDRAEGAHAPLGLPLGGRGAWVLDAELNPLPRGQAGELCLGGALLARGYAGRAGLTAERFVADPRGAPGERLYRTGDLVRWNADGQLDYLGRLDHQLKLRGYRVEPGEVEARLLAQDGVREAVVMAWRDVLAAYVAPHAGKTLDVGALKRALAAELPPHMVPASVTLLERLPTTAGGKVDRGALPAPGFEDEAWTAPEGEVETALALLWSEVLGVHRPGREDNFFEAGGHSLKAMELAALLQARHGWQAPLRSFFEWPVLADHAREVLAPQLGTGAGPDAIDNLLAEFEV